ncbi:hypothetical protein D3C76_1256110 [compost metagenome]
MTNYATFLTGITLGPKVLKVWVLSGKPRLCIPALTIGQGFQVLQQPGVAPVRFIAMNDRLTFFGIRLVFHFIQQCIGFL